MTAENGLKAMKSGLVCWMSETVKECQDCGQDLSEHKVVQVKTVNQYMKGAGI